MQNDSAKSSLIMSSAASQKWPRRLDETHTFKKMSPRLERETCFVGPESALLISKLERELTFPVQN